MKEIAQRTLRNESGRILREAAAGERFVVTVHGRPVAVLEPYERRAWLAGEEIRQLLTTPSDPDLVDDLREQEPQDPQDPWLR